jgi:hypothetical protein
MTPAGQPSAAASVPPPPGTGAKLLTDPAGSGQEEAQLADVGPEDPSAGVTPDVSPAPEAAPPAPLSPAAAPDAGGAAAPAPDLSDACFLEPEWVPATGEVLPALPPGGGTLLAQTAFVAALGLVADTRRRTESDARRLGHSFTARGVPA